MAERLVVIGGDAGGMGAASQARRRRADLDIVALEKGNWTSYSACGIPYLVAGDVPAVDKLVARSPKEFRDRFNIDVRLRHEVMALDLAKRCVEVHDHEHDRTYQLGFDHVLVGTGARPLRPPIPGIDLDHVHGVQTLDDGARLLERARQIRCQRVVVIGAGYIGLEMAEAFVRWGAQVAMVDVAPEVMRTLDPDMGWRVRQQLEAFGVDVRLGTGVQSIEPGVVQTSAGPIAADLVVLGMGVTPNSSLVADTGVPTGVRGAIRVDRRQRVLTGNDVLDGVWAAGDCCESHHLVSQRPVHVALGTVANKQARVAGINLGGGYASFAGVVGTAITKVCSTEVARTGLTEAEAVAAGFGYETATIEATTRAGYFPGSVPIAVKMLGERSTRRLLGAQIVGGEGSGKRIDVVATALHARMTIDDLIDLDLAYAPPFSPVWDPVVVAARQVAASLHGSETNPKHRAASLR